jgi:hypothetical protein
VFRLGTAPPESAKATLPPEKIEPAITENHQERERTPTVANTTSTTTNDPSTGKSGENIV